jgi:hypothetical protein
MLTKSKVFLAAALILGTASAALAGDQTDERGGYALPGSTDGVNPVYHPGWFPNYPRTGSWSADPANGGQAYGFAPAIQPTHRTTHERTQTR